MPEMVVGHISYSDKPEVRGRGGNSHSLRRTVARPPTRSSLHNPPESGANEIVRESVSRPGPNKRTGRAASKKAREPHFAMEAMRGNP